METKKSVKKTSNWKLNLIVLLVLLIAWEIAGRQVSELLLAPPSSVFKALVRLITSGELARSLMISLQSLLVAFIVSVAISIPLGLMIGYFKPVAFLLEPLVNALYATPLVALIPLVMLWFGMRLKGKVFFIVLTGIFPIIINTVTGVRQTDKKLVEVARSFKASEWQIIKEIVLPYSLPYMLTGVRLGIGRAVVGMILAEMYLALEGGLGHLIIAYGAALSTANLFALLIVIPLLGISLSKITKMVESKLTPWRKA